MVLTKEQVIIVLQRLKKRQLIGSVKYYTIGCMQILVAKDLVTIPDILAAFPELDNP